MSYDSRANLSLELRGDLRLQKLESLGYRLCDPTFSRFSTVLVELRLVTDGQTDGHRAMASTANA